MARLGAGGMGIVYLARTAAGELVALKVIRSEHAGDPHFRARFQREARLAAHLRSPWVVRVTDADTESRAPWLATAFVAGPTLAETVATLGPLPARSVLVLGRRIAEALTDLHTTGLLHRDIKPTNILLDRSGPRLIDFGIAWGPATTTLTTPDAVLGTPGYLPPEQVHGDSAGPASDVFALGCVLVHAATGRAPFGTGNPAVVLYRTVHEEPDLDGLARLPDPARATIVRCLAKDPAQRPGTAELRDALHRTGALTRPGPRPSRTGEPPGSRPPLPDPRLPLAHLPSPAPPQADGADGADDWLPPGVLRLIAAHAARALDPPPRADPPAHEEGGPRETAEGSGEPEKGPEAPDSTRRRFLAVGGTATAVLATGVIGAALALRRGPGDGPPTRTIALHGTDTEEQRGAELAVNAHNSRSGIRFRLALTALDDRGRPAGTEAAARRLIADQAVCAVLGPASGTAVRAAGPLYAAARMPMVLVSSTVGELPPGSPQPDDPSTTCVTRIGDELLGMPLAYYLTGTRPSRRTAVIEDEAGGTVATELAAGFRDQPPVGGTATLHPVAAHDDIRPAVAQALAGRPQAVVYAGTSPERAAACARALAAARFTGARLTIGPVMRPAFLTAAGAAAEDWVFASPYTEPASMTTEGARAFTAAYRARHGTAPGPWAAEAYDAVNLVARALEALGGGSRATRGRIVDQLFRTTLDGVAKPVRFLTGQDHSFDPTHTAFLFQARHDRFEFLGRYDRLKPVRRGPVRH
ncbi:hypothetical protein GCM10018793_57550 [Streptomyces sulfonofaciens]|uniref:Protein kinase domain-containing protein n=1 Tax=Streptomyces sulfonofaciens TaxID=68272 RepID=A0A919GLI4_9ACTN|nr:hypothetical protein GCM10018793_57550 [Streptomyces sulfonofaciens]